MYIWLLSKHKQSSTFFPPSCFLNRAFRSWLAIRKVSQGKAKTGNYFIGKKWSFLSQTWLQETECILKHQLSHWWLKFWSENLHRSLRCISCFLTLTLPFPIVLFIFITSVMKKLTGFGTQGKAKLMGEVGALVK